MEWKIITKEIIDDKGQVVIVETAEQIDTVGNIYQKSGGVIPKACQVCKKEFTSVIESIPIKETVPFYSCQDCNFENAGGEATLDHKLLNSDHQIKKITKDRIVTYKNIIKGRKANITLTDDDAIILCDDCMKNGS